MATTIKLKGTALKAYPEQPAADQKVVDEVFHLWAGHRRFMILAGPPGVGKTRAAEDAVREILRKRDSENSLEETRLTALFPQFRSYVYSQKEIEDKLIAKNVDFVWDLCAMHSQITYEDLIRGYRMATPTATSHAMSLEVREGILGFICRVSKAIHKIKGKDELPNAVLVLDEINRAPLGQVLGEAMYALDRRDQFVATPYHLAGDSSVISIPEGVLLLGTMNSVDRAISGFDFALRRRFSTIYLTSSPVPIETRFKVFDAATSKAALKLYEAVNELVKNANQTGAVPPAELMIGHSYFLPPEEVTIESEAIDYLATSILYQVLPTLVDYAEQGLIEYKESDLKSFAFGDVLRGEVTIAGLDTANIRKRILLTTAATATADA